MLPTSSTERSLSQPIQISEIPPFKKNIQQISTSNISASPPLNASPSSSGFNASPPKIAEIPPYRNRPRKSKEYIPDVCFLIY